jgi:AraC family transcriptional regulator
MHVPNEAQMFKTPVFGVLHLVSPPPTASTQPIPFVMPSVNCQETAVSRSAQLLSHAMTLLETNHDAWCCLDGALTLLRGYLQESPANAASAVGVRQSGLARWQSRAAIEHINANLASKLTLAEIAKVVSLSKGHFSRAFKISLGVTPWAYIITARVERAKRMIRATREPLSQISSACGFADQAHLCRAFRRWVGASPGIWRRAHLAVCTMEKGKGDANRWSFDPAELTKTLATLVDKSLVTSDGGSAARYRLPETTRAYAWQKLSESAEDQKIARRHCEQLTDSASVVYSDQE